MIAKQNTLKRQLSKHWIWKANWFSTIYHKKVICDSLQLDKENKNHVYFFDKQYYKNQELLLEYHQLDDQAWNARG